MDLLAAVEALRERGFGNPLGLVGFCFGGGRLMHEISLAENGANPAAAVAFYPTSTFLSRFPCSFQRLLHLILERMKAAKINILFYPSLYRI